jgi:hypothetical protein
MTDEEEYRLVGGKFDGDIAVNTNRDTERVLKFKEGDFKNRSVYARHWTGGKLEFKFIGIGDDGESKAIEAFRLGQNER